MTSTSLGIDCYLGLGSNLNNPINQLNTGIQHLNKLRQTQVIGISNFYRSEPWGVIDQNDFVNAVVKINTRLKPKQLLKEVEKIEYRLMQRQNSARWHSRVIDIDLLLCGHETMNRDDLKLPHPWISERCFVIQPLSELKPILPTDLTRKITHHRKNHQCSSQLIKINKPKITGFKGN